MTEDKIQAYRQPMVTAAGVILGFVLTFANSWVKTDTAVPEVFAYVVFALILVGQVCLIAVLSRILRMGVTPDRAVAYYSRTLRLFVAGVSCSVAGVLIDVFSNFLSP